MSDVDAEAYSIASNHHVESGGWYCRGLTEMLEDIAEDPSLLDAVGVTAEEIDELLRRAGADEPATDTVTHSHHRRGRFGRRGR